MESKIIELLSIKKNNNLGVKEIAGILGEDKEEVHNTLRLLGKEGIVYKNNNDKYILTNINKVYDIIDYEYLDIDNINNYLNNATLENDIYKVYLKDIILNNTSNKYITIKLLDNSVEIDYTYLLNILNNSNYDTFILKIHK